MKLEEISAYLLKGRIVDLSKKVNPGGADGAVGAPRRKYEIEQFTFPPGELMHNIVMESHISTHVEAPSHFVPVLHGRDAEDVSEVALEKFFGMGMLINCKDMAPKTAMGPEILSQFDIRQGDIVLIGNSPHKGEDRPWLTPEGTEYIYNKKIKMIGFDDSVYVERPEVSRKYLDKYIVHDLFLSSGVPVIEQMAHLGDLRKPRFFFMGIPARMGGLESFPIRAVAIEDPEGV